MKIYRTADINGWNKYSRWITIKYLKHHYTVPEGNEILDVRRRSGLITEAKTGIPVYFLKSRRSAHLESWSGCQLSRLKFFMPSFIFPR